MSARIHFTTNVPGNKQIEYKIRGIHQDVPFRLRQSVADVIIPALPWRLIYDLHSLKTIVCFS